MVERLLMRGMLVGIVAEILSFSFLKVVGEPQVDRAIAFESQLEEAKAKAAADKAMAQNIAMPATEAEEELVSRPTQAVIGLFTGVAVYNVAFGGLRVALWPSRQVRCSDICGLDRGHGFRFGLSCTGSQISDHPLISRTRGSISLSVLLARA